MKNKSNTTSFRSGSNIEAKNDFGRTPLHLASLNLQFEVVQLLKRNGADINAKDSQGNNILHIASMFGLYEAIPFLKDIGLHIDSKNDRGQTALFLASNHNQPLSLFILIKSGAGKDDNAKLSL